MMTAVLRVSLSIPCIGRGQPIWQTGCRSACLPLPSSGIHTKPFIRLCAVRPRVVDPTWYNDLRVSGTFAAGS